jgi:hypothetical protein
MSTPSGTRTAPVASGTLDSVPLPHALVYLRNKRLSGVLELRVSPERHAWLAVWRGLVVSSVTTPAVARFGTVVYEMGFIDASVLDSSTIESANTKRPQMDILIERGAITPAQRDAILVEQMRRRVHHLFTLPPSTSFTFREGSPSTSEPSVAVDLLAPIWRGLCDFPPDDRAAEVLGRLGDHPLRLVSEAVIERAELGRQELALCEALGKAPMSLAQLRRATKLPQARVDLLAYLLVITKCVEVEGAERAPAPSSAMWAAASVPRAASTAVESVRSEAARPETARAAPALGPLDVGAAGIRRRAAHLSMETPFTTLGLAEGASAEAARAAFFRLGKLWHPDRVPPQLEEVHAEIEAIFTQMTQAHRLLTDPAARPAVVARKTP